MQILSVLEEQHPLMRALVDAGCLVSHVGPWEIPESGDPVLYLGDVFEQVKRPLVLARLRAKLASRGIPYAMWNRDAPWDCAIKPWRRWIIRGTRPVDLHLAHSRQSAATFGDAVIYFPNAADTAHYNLGGRSLESLRAPEAYEFDVSFTGTLDPRFSRVRSRVEFLRALRTRLQSLDIRCELFDTSLGSPLTVADQARLIRSSRINLSIGAVCDDPVKSWGLPERCFGVAACGGFLLCDERKHAAETFPEEAWTSFGDLEDCVRRIRTHLADFDATRRKAELLHACVLERHTYAHRANQLLQLAQAWRRSASAPRAQARPA
jgi:spore maturation protein CgeB